jgi:pimeloyl-ACP methyl ester carboxylesterase
MILSYDDTELSCAHTERREQRAPVVLVHGLGATANVWGAQIAALAPHFRVLAPDLRGCGRSAKAPVSLAALVADLVELIDGAGFETAHLVGHSLGSVIVQHLAVAHPQMVESVALVGPIQAPSDAGRQGLRNRAQQARRGALAAVADATVLAGTAPATRHERPELAAFVRELVMRQDPESYAQTCETLVALEPAAIETLRCPALVVTGDQDATAPPTVAQAIADQIRGARYAVLAQCGHWTPIEQAAALSDVLLDFLLTVSLRTPQQRAN